MRLPVTISLCVAPSSWPNVYIAVIISILLFSSVTLYFYINLVICILYIFLHSICIFGNTVIS
ncbi:hypothetical protein BX661DRAFT_97725 [Kickxella alabastrina]|uniref:uncharacterized protein n=1 Tax=Kickxella alabastrina TaxID=61397 RepID=UPI00221F3E73|nr:uncharacterized protein BX661DRAFT_97725 [Kickxella alabastrina]KAI7830151.1 hypothetical protein BX661DRAFT_97725 [Kickxella alabastrina]